MKANIASQVMETLRTSSTQSNPTLKPGQMVTGKVQKLYPGQRALIQIGSQRMNAQLEAALNLHGRYIFQVKSTEDLVHLKVLGDASPNQGEKGVASLLSQLGLAYQKDRASFVQQLIKQNIPFNQNELKQSISLLEKFSATSENKSVLLEMMNKKLPMKESIFLALRERMNNSQTLTSSLQYLNQQADGNQLSSKALLKFLNNTNQTLSEHLEKVLGRSSEQSQPSTYSLLQKAKLIPANQTQGDWNERIKSWISNATNASNSGSSTAWNSVPLSQTNMESIAKRMVELFQKQLPLSKGESQQLKTLSENLSGLVEGTPQSNDKQVRALQQIKQTSNSMQQEGVLNKLTPQLEKQGVSKEALRQFINQVQSLQSVDDAKQTIGRMRQVYQALHDMANSQLHKQETRTLVPLLSSIQQEYPGLLANGKDHFLTQLKTVMQQSGLNYEHQLMNQPDGVEATRVESTLKGSILQGLQDSLSTQVSDKLTSMLNHLNGMVLSVQDTDQTLQMNLQLPGNWFGIEQDLIMDLEGRKNDQDEVDPDYCHILFYLQLESLDETVIDMRIQKRIVQLSLYTDNKQAENLIKTFKPMLEEGLEKLDYTLSTVRHRTLETEAGTNEKGAKQRYSNPYPQGGVDFRI